MTAARGVEVCFSLESDRRSVAGWLCVAVTLVLAASHLLTPGKANTWMRPAVTLVFLGYVVGLAWRPRAPLDAPRRAAARLGPHFAIVVSTLPRVVLPKGDPTGNRSGADPEVASRLVRGRSAP